MQQLEDKIPMDTHPATISSASFADDLVVKATQSKPFRCKPRNLHFTPMGSTRCFWQHK